MLLAMSSTYGGKPSILREDSLHVTSHVLNLRKETINIKRRFPPCYKPCPQPKEGDHQNSKAQGPYNYLFFAHIHCKTKSFEYSVTWYLLQHTNGRINIFEFKTFRQRSQHNKILFRFRLSF